MQDKRNTESVVQEIMGLVHNAMSSYTLYKQAVSEGWNNDDIEGRVVNDLALIKAKLRELVREPLSDDAVLDAFCNEPHQNQFVSVFKQGVRYAERSHHITNTNKE